MLMKHLSPSRLKKYQLCTLRAVAQATDDDYEESAKHEGTLAGVLSHNAAKHWYRPNPLWSALVREEKDPYRRAAMISQRVIKGVDKHVITDPDHAFKMAIEEVAGDQELPCEATSVVEARGLFEKIMTHYNRDVVNVLCTERTYKGPLPNGVPVYIIIDMILDRGNGHLDIIDFKTGWIKIENDELWSDHQVLMNLLVASRDPMLSPYPHKNFQLFWVRDSFVSDSVSLSPNQLTDYEFWLMYEFQRLRDLKPEDAKPTVNRFCSSCGIKLKCPAYTSMVTEAFGEFTPMTPERLTALSLDDIMEQVMRIKAQVKLLEAFEKTLNDKLEGTLRDADSTELVGTNLKVRRRQNKKKDYDTETVLNLAVAHNKKPSDLLNVKKKIVENTFEGIPEAQNQLINTMHSGFASSWIEVCAAGHKKKSA